MRRFSENPPNPICSFIQSGDFIELIKVEVHCPCA